MEGHLEPLTQSYPLSTFPLSTVPLYVLCPFFFKHHKHFVLGVTKSQI